MRKKINSMSTFFHFEVEENHRFSEPQIGDLEVDKIQNEFWEPQKSRFLEEFDEFRY